jgi:nucleotide-binding universal stress UspA family protein
MTPTGIVVGFDGSPDAEQAVAWAAREARARRCRLTVCLAREHADEAQPAEPAEPASPAKRGEPKLGSSQEVLARGLRVACELIGSEAVRPLHAAGSPATILCGCAESAEMVVLGSRGRGGLPQMPIGSTSLQVAAHARGRIVVVRGHWRPVPGQPSRPIVVGCDGSPGSQAAVKFAVEEAALRDVCVVAVCALADSPGLLGGAGQIRAEFEQVMSQPRTHPEVAVNQQVRQGSARTALLEAARDAQLLVLGARGRGGLPGMPLGSASVALLSHAACPVAIAHADD